MKILHICAVTCTVDSLLKTQLEFLKSRGFTVGIACSPGQELAKFASQGFFVHPVQIERSITSLTNLNSVYQLVRIMREQGYDLVHVHTPIASVIGRIAAKIAGVKAIVYTSHGLPFHDLSSPFQYRLYSTVEKLSATITDLIISQNYEDIDTAIRIGMCSPDKLRYLGNGVDIKRFQRSHLNQQKQIQLRQSLKIPDSANLIVGTVGRLNRKKGSEYLVEAAAKLIKKFPHLHILVIGGEISTDPDPFQTQLIAKIRSLGIENHVTLTGTRADIPELLGLLDIFTLPTYTHEGLPRSIVEAMAMELPVVATNIRGCREAVIDGETGLIIPPKDSDSLATALGKLLSHSQLRQAYGQAGRHRVETEYDEDFVFERLVNFYRDLGVFVPKNSLVTA